MGKKVNVHAAKVHLSRLLQKAQVSEEAVVARGGIPRIYMFSLYRSVPSIWKHSIWVLHFRYGASRPVSPTSERSFSVPMAVADRYQHP